MPDDPPENRHVLWGALVNGPGPDPVSDEHVDKRGDYGSNEVTIDYNSAFLAAIVANYDTMGSTQCPIADFPPIEPRIDEFYTRDKINTKNECFTQTQVTLINESIHPPRYDEHLSIRFYINVSELIAAGVDPAKMKFHVFNDSAGSCSGRTAKVTGPVACEANGDMWYAEIKFEGEKFWGEMPVLGAPRTVMIEYGVESNPGCVWDPSNDWSTQTLTDWTQSAITINEETKNPYVTVYSEGKLLFGEEPKCHPTRRIVVPPPEAPVLQ
jgi:hypothetical protein